jgi:uncharacterized damage-inducible protein DinB
MVASGFSGQSWRVCNGPALLALHVYSRQDNAPAAPRQPRLARAGETGRATGGDKSMTYLGIIRSLWDHAVWADHELYRAVAGGGDAVAEAVREYSHIIGAAETWLARLEQRAPRCAVWPTVSLDEVSALRERTEAAYRAYLARLADEDLSARVTYTNSAGLTFTDTVANILLHVALHGQYHRGKVNLLLRQAGCAPAPTDYIAFVRGAPAATEATSRAQR